MRVFGVVFMMVPLLFVAGPAAAQSGDAQAGKTLWEGPATQCRNCHGAQGEGGFGPDLAGRRLTIPQFTRALRQPWGVMPAYIESQISDKEVADLVAYFDSLPAAAEPGAWRTTVPPNATHGQEIMIAAAGCGQCHGPQLGVPRADAGAVGADFEWFKTYVYDHTVNMDKHWALIGEKPAVRVRMGNYSRTRLPEAVLQEIWNYAKDAGLRVKMNGTLSAGVAAANGVTYTLEVENIGVPDKGLTAEDLTIALVVPQGANVVATTGPGYQGVREDAQLKGNVAVWQLPQMKPKERQTYTLTLSRAGTAADNVRGSIRWMKPPVKPGPADQVAIAPAPLPRATN